MIVSYHELASNEIVHATAYYAGVRFDLGAAFLAELNVAIEQIAADPLRFEQVRPGVRRILLERFPYGIYYRLPNAGTVRIIVVRHHRRRPGLGMRRR